MSIIRAGKAARRHGHSERNFAGRKYNISRQGNSVVYTPKGSGAVITRKKGGV